MLKLNYFLADIFILSAEKQPIKLSWRKIEWLPLLANSGVSRNFVGIIFYTRKVLLTSHYEKRLFEHASQPRVAGSDIRLLSYLWS